MEREVQAQLKNEEPIQNNREAVQEEQRSGQKFEGANGNNVPPVEAEAKAPAEEVENITELKEKIKMVIDYRFNGSFKEAFEHYGMADDKVDAKMVRALLTDSGVSSKGKWVKTIMSKMDTIDGRIAYGEFESFATSRWD